MAVLCHQLFGNQAHHAPFNIEWWTTLLWSKLFRQLLLMRKTTRSAISLPWPTLSLKSTSPGSALRLFEWSGRTHIFRQGRQKREKLPFFRENFSKYSGGIREKKCGGRPERALHTLKKYLERALYFSVTTSSNHILEALGLFSANVPILVLPISVRILCTLPYPALLLYYLPIR